MPKRKKSGPEARSRAAPLAAASTEPAVRHAAAAEDAGADPRPRLRLWRPQPRPRRRPTPARRGARARNPLFPVGVSLYPLDAESAEPGRLVRPRPRRGPRALAERAASRSCASSSPGACSSRRSGSTTRTRSQRCSTWSSRRATQQHAGDRVLLRRRPARRARRRAVGQASATRAPTRYLIQREIALVAAGRQRRCAPRPASSPGSSPTRRSCSRFDLGRASSRSGRGCMREAIREVDPERPITLGLDAETFFRATGVDARDAIDDLRVRRQPRHRRLPRVRRRGPVTSGPVDLPRLVPAARSPTAASRCCSTTSARSRSTSRPPRRPRRCAPRCGRGWRTARPACSCAACATWRPSAASRTSSIPFETLVGVVDVGGRAQAVVRRRRAGSCAPLRASTCARFAPTPERTAVIMPAERYEPLPEPGRALRPARVPRGVRRREGRRTCRSRVADEADDFAEYSVLIVPSAFELAEETWERLATFVQGGGSLVLSYGGGDAHPAIRELFGVEFAGRRRCRARCSRAAWRRTACSGALDELRRALRGSELRAAVRRTARRSSPPTRRAARSSPSTSSARAVRSTSPCRSSARSRRATRGRRRRRCARLLREVYGAVARAAGCGAPVACCVPEVEVALFQGEADDVLVLINHAPETVERRARDRPPRRRPSSTSQSGAPAAVGGTAFRRAARARTVRSRCGSRTVRRTHGERGEVASMADSERIRLTQLSSKAG